MAEAKQLPGGGRIGVVVRGGQVLYFSYGVAVESDSAFGAEEIELGVCCGLIEQVGSFSGAGFNMDWAETSENPDKIDFAIQIFAFQ